MNDYPIEPGSPDDEFDLPRLGQLLRHYRKRAGLSQRDLSAYTKIDQANISLIESGRIAAPHNSTLETFAGVLAQHIAIPAPQILARLIEAKEQAPVEYGIDPAMVLLADRLSVYTPNQRRIIYDLFNKTVDAFDRYTDRA